MTGFCPCVSLCDRWVCVWGGGFEEQVVFTGTDQVRHRSQWCTVPLQLPDLWTGQTTRASGHGGLIENNRPKQSYSSTPNDGSTQQFPSQLFHFTEGGNEVMLINCPVTSWKALKFNMAKSQTTRIWAHRGTCSSGAILGSALLSVPGGRLARFLFLLFSVAFSRGGHSVTSGPLEPLNWRGSLLVAGSKDRALSPARHKKPHYSQQSEGSWPKQKQLWIMKRKQLEFSVQLCFLYPNSEGHHLDTHHWKILIHILFQWRKPHWHGWNCNNNSEDSLQSRSEDFSYDSSNEILSL